MKVASYFISSSLYKIIKLFWIIYYMRQKMKNRFFSEMYTYWNSKLWRTIKDKWFDIFMFSLRIILLKFQFVGTSVENPVLWRFAKVENSYALLHSYLLEYFKFLHSILEISINEEKWDEITITSICNKNITLKTVHEVNRSLALSRKRKTSAPPSPPHLPPTFFLS